jgi:hypothetical protein
VVISDAPSAGNEWAKRFAYRSIRTSAQDQGEYAARLAFGIPDQNGESGK